MTNHQARIDKRKAPKAFSNDPNTVMQEMMVIIDSLRGIYVRENEALAHADTKTFLALQDIKLETAKQYQQNIEHILENKSDMRQAHPSLKSRLAVMQEEFAELGRKNMDALQRMQRCTQRLGDTIMHSAKEEAKKQRAVNYAETGILAASEKRHISIGINETA
jgi:uncharacterized protein YukE